MFSGRFSQIQSFTLFSQSRPLISVLSRYPRAVALAPHRSKTTQSPPRARLFPVTGFEPVPPSIKLEEEQLPFYSAKIFYPVRLGQVFQGRYQVVAKLGYDATSTTWLGHDLPSHRYVTLKVHINTLQHNQELLVYQQLKTITASHHAGQHSIRMVRDIFEVDGPHGVHQVFVLPPLGISLRSLQERMPGEVFDGAFVRAALQQSIPALDFLHGEANITHTDFHSGNLLLGLRDDSPLAECVEAEFTKPTARKEVGGVTIYASRLLLAGDGPLYLCDFGEARIGSQHEGPAMPMPYRAPEILLGMEWGHSVDMWSVALVAWDLLEPESLFRIYDPGDTELNQLHHLANMVALLGPPPEEFLSRSSMSRKFWDAQGKWIGAVPIPTHRSLESRLGDSLQEDEKAVFLDFIRALLRWLPQERLTTGEANLHPWMAYQGT